MHINLKKIFKIRSKKNKYSTVHYLLAMLKEYGLKYAVASPGTQNANFNYFLQEDDTINVFSVIDERSAGYVANGIAQESNEPCVITSTGATASRNFVPAMTEAYYKKVPIIAVTFFDYGSTKYSFMPQYVDRSVTQNDIKYIDVELPRISDNADRIKCLTYLNSALTTAFHRHLPVHINCPSHFDFDINKLKSLPKDIWVNKYYKEDFTEIKNVLTNKKIAIHISAHTKFTDKEITAIEKFAETYGAVVLCDHIANYHGKNKILLGQAFGSIAIKEKPDIIIDIGDVSGEYYVPSAFKRTEIWRVTNNLEIKYRFNIPVTKLFDCSEKYFFELLSDNIKVDVANSYYNKLLNEINNIQIPELPLCMGFVSYHLSKHLPKNCSLHLGILNSLRNMDFFNLDSSIKVVCNNGGFGIDGAISTLVGQSLVSFLRGGGEETPPVFGLVGDLAFFYDMNILGNRHIKNNVRILVVNNNRGEEMRLNSALDNPLGNKIDELITACGHNKNGLKLWAESCEFEYLCAKTKESFIEQIDKFCNGKYSKPVIFEVFTKDEDEKSGLNLMQSYNRKK